MSAGPTAWCRSPERGRYRSGAEKSPLPEFPATLRAAAHRYAEVACAAESVQSPKSMGPFPARRTSAARPAWSEACQPAVARRARPGFAGAPPCRRTVARACGRDQKRDGVAAELRAWPLVTQATDIVANASTPALTHNEGSRTSTRRVRLRRIRGSAIIVEVPIIDWNALVGVEVSTSILVRGARGCSCILNAQVQLRASAYERAKHGINSSPDFCNAR